MLPEIELDALRYLDREALEALQMHSRYLRNLVIRQACSLPVRSIQEVDVSVASIMCRTVTHSPNHLYKCSFANRSPFL